MTSTTFLNNQTFVFERPLSAWSALYDLSSGVLRAQMRPSADSPILLYEWAGPNDTRGTARGAIDLLAMKAVGTMMFDRLPVAGDVVTFGSAVVTFVAEPAVGLQVQIRPTLESTLSALVDLLSASSNADISQCTYSLAAATLLTRFKQPGLAGNAFEIGAESNVVTISGPTLSEGGAAAVLSAPLADVEAFKGAFVYDLRFEAPSMVAVLDSGSIIFAKGVTR